MPQHPSSPDPTPSDPSALPARDPEHAAGSHHHDRRFPLEKLARLDAPERRERMPPAPLVELIAAGAPRRVLDVGVGTGYFALPLCQALPGATVIGLDVEPVMLETFRERAEDRGQGEAIATVLAPPDAIPLLDRSVDAVLLANVYHELDHRPRYLAEIRRVLEPGGTLVVCDWRTDRGLDAGPPLHHRVAAEDAISELDAAGFDAIRELELYDSYYVLAAKR